MQPSQLSIPKIIQCNCQPILPNIKNTQKSITTPTKTHNRPDQTIFHTKFPTAPFPTRSIFQTVAPTRAAQPASDIF